jgi:hypothetical protein
VSKKQPTFDDYEKALHTMLDENEALQAEIVDVKGQLSTLVDWIMGDADALTTLQRVYLNPDEPAANRIKAAAAAIGYEKPKLAATANIVIDFRERVRQARLKADAKLLAEAKLAGLKVIEHQPEPGAPAPTPAA